MNVDPLRYMCGLFGQAPRVDTCSSRMMNEVLGCGEPAEGPGGLADRLTILTNAPGAK